MGRGCRFHPGRTGNLSLEAMAKDMYKMKKEGGGIGEIDSY
jgi:hypothetical protein